MPSMETYYLIDFENVNESGLSGAEKLVGCDHVHLFFTENSPKISIEKFTNFNRADLSAHKIPAGNQSLDMHLVSYLGYLLGTNIAKKCKYVIISKDTDYDNIVSFWKAHHNADITRRNKIAVIASPNKPKAVSKKNTVMNASQRKVQLNTRVMKTICDAGYSHLIAGKVASVVVKHFGESKFAGNVHNELRECYADYLALYKAVKPIIAEYSSTPDTEKKNAIAELNSGILEILDKAGFKNDVKNYVVSLIPQYFDKQNFKQNMYRSIIAKYGQKEGLKIYKSIKIIL